jgi:23S rRNA (pseudouridine1915-N3)-methyltransferase
MTVTLICIGKTNVAHVRDGMTEYASRLHRYCKFKIIETPAGKGIENEIRRKEEAILLNLIDDRAYLVLLDETGREFSSIQFAEFIGRHQNYGTRNLIFVIGGAYGFSENIHKRANGKVSLSKMTFPHQLVRLIFLEQLYRAFTILKGEKYHH